MKTYFFTSTLRGKAFPLTIGLLAWALLRGGFANCYCEAPTAERFAVEARFSGQFFLTKLLKDIYGSGVNYEILGTIPVWKGVEVWLAADYFYKKGHSSALHTPTRITLVPLTIGPRYTHYFGNFIPYVGVGFKCYYLHLHNSSTLVVEKISKWGPGVVGEVGCKYSYCDSFFIDGFFNYSYAHFNKISNAPPNVQRSALNLQTCSVGGGIGYQF